MNRYRLDITYNGTHYAGWQRQPAVSTVQEAVETSLTTFTRESVAVVGCGRTDAGVHARRFALHFDLSNTLEQKALKGINALLPDDIAAYDIALVSSDFHARYTCIERGYTYHLHRRKDPFKTGRSFHFHQFEKTDKGKVEQAAEMLLNYGSFFPFCKSHSGVEHYRCNLYDSRWTWDDEGLTGKYEIRANRFLRGMVRLIVGMQLNVGLGQLSLEELHDAMEAQSRLKKDWSVPACGLFLDRLVYP